MHFMHDEYAVKFVENYQNQIYLFEEDKFFNFLPIELG